MPNINKEITLTSKGKNAGPNFDVFYSTDCINYTLCIDGDNVSLPSIGSTTIVTVPDNVTCIKLVNLSAVCGENYVISGSVTTTTTTAAPTTTTTSTTTTTTTAAPTTTTTTLAPSTATLSWTFSITGGATGVMDIYVNGSIVETRNSTSSGTRSVNIGDTINVEISTSSCQGLNDKANAYCTGIINDAACGDGTTGLFTAVYTVVSGDAGTTLTLNNFAACSEACL